MPPKCISGIWRALWNLSHMKLHICSFFIHWDNKKLIIEFFVRLGIPLCVPHMLLFCNPLDKWSWYITVSGLLAHIRIIRQVRNVKVSFTKELGRFGTFFYLNPTYVTCLESLIICRILCHLDPHHNYQEGCKCTLSLLLNETVRYDKFTSCLYHLIY